MSLEVSLLIAGQVLNAIAVIVALVSLRKTIEYTRWSKAIEITNTYLRAFGNLRADALKVVDGELEESDYWQRFWYFQQDQYYLWKRDLIDDNFYQGWMLYRAREWEADELCQLEGYRKGFHDVAGDLMPEFREFMESVFARRYPQ